MASTQEKQEKQESAAVSRRRILNIAISNILAEKGFETVEKQCLETLTEMFQSLICEIGTSARNYAELAGRTEAVCGDIVVALVNMGISVQGLEAFAKRESRSIIPIPQQVSATKQNNLLSAGVKNSHPSHIPNHLPPLPDPHAYIRTPTHKQPVTEYEAIREKAANQKRDIERALTRFLAKTSDTQSLFDAEDNQMFPLIACKPCQPSYYAALNPTDQVFDFEELEYHYQVANRTEDAPSKDSESGNEDDGDEKDTEKSDKKSDDDAGGSGEASAAVNENPNIDNPYLRAAIIPKRVKLDVHSNN